MSTQRTDSTKAYLAGWKAGQSPTFGKVTRADSRGAPAAWYIGYFDAEGGNSKFAGMPTLSKAQHTA